MDEAVGPGMRHQFNLADNVAGPAHQQGQQIKGPAAKMDRLVMVEEKLTFRQQVKGAEPVAGTQWCRPGASILSPAVARLLHQISPHAPAFVQCIACTGN